MSFSTGGLANLILDNRYCVAKISNVKEYVRSKRTFFTSCDVRPPGFFGRVSQISGRVGFGDGITLLACTVCPVAT